MHAPFEGTAIVASLTEEFENADKSSDFLDPIDRARFDCEVSSRAHIRVWVEQSEHGQVKDLVRVLRKRLEVMPKVETTSRFRANITFRVGCLEKYLAGEGPLTLQDTSDEVLSREVVLINEVIERAKAFAREHPSASSRLSLAVD